MAGSAFSTKTPKIEANGAQAVLGGFVGCQVLAWEPGSVSSVQGGLRMFRAVLSVAAATMLLTAGAFAQVSCNSFGTMTTCSNGLTAQRFGNQTIYNNGVSSQQFGNQTIYSDGLSAQRFGNQTIYNNGVTSQQFGNQTLFSNGTTCTRFGNQTICN